ncbi:MAG: diacylglycerol/lipid kinase family protein [Solirubrobacteraceae bacterium]
MARQIALIANPAAGGGRAARLLPGVVERLNSLGVTVRAEVTRDLPHARELAGEAARDGETVVTLGGDGLVGAVAGAMRTVPGSVMGVLPGGRGNDFCRMTQIPLDALEACEVIASGTERTIDAGEADGQTFIGIASLGFDSDANRYANAAPARLGPLVYVYGALRAMLGWKHAQFTVVVDGERTSFSGWTVAAANSGLYGGGMLLAPDARIDDGKLDVVLTQASGRTHFLRTLPKVFKGSHVQDPRVIVLRGREVEIDADRPFVVYADGDPIGELPITIRAVPGALRVLLPA